MATSDMVRLLVSLVIATFMCRRGLRKQSLSRSGAGAAFVMGVCHMSCGWTFGLVLICFFLTSTKFTKFRQEQKAKLDAHIKPGGQRNALQVLCNSGGGAAAAIVVQAAPLLLQAAGVEDTAALLPIVRLAAWSAFSGHYACCCADTWASELGMLSSSRPRLITQLQRTVPPGVNGGVTLLGFLASAAGGCAMGLALALLGCATGELQQVQPLIHNILGLCTTPQSPQVLSTVVEQAVFWLVLSLLCGLAGSVVDSILGATLQYSGYCSATGKVVSAPGPQVKHISGMALLSNDAVNATSACLSSTAAAVAGVWLSYHARTCS